MCAYFPSFFSPLHFPSCAVSSAGLLSKQACLKGSTFPWVEWQDTPADVFAAATSPFMPFYLFKSPTLWSLFRVLDFFLQPFVFPPFLSMVFKEGERSDSVQFHVLLICHSSAWRGISRLPVSLGQAGWRECGTGIPDTWTSGRAPLRVCIILHTYWELISLLLSPVLLGNFLISL